MRSRHAIWAVATTSFCIACIFGAGTVRLIAGLSLLTALAWGIGPLTLVFLILAGLALAAAHALSTVPIALAVGAGALAAARDRELRLNPLAIVGAGVFAVAAALAVRYASVSATADANAASSPAVWAYPSGSRLQVGVREPPGQESAPLRVVVAQAGARVTAWDDIRLAPGQTWELTLAGSGPVRVTVLRAGTVVARVSS